MDSPDIVEAFVKAFVSFVAVNIDEFIVLVVFFASVDHSEFKNIHVISGQLIGFTIIFLISALGILLGSFVSLDYIALLGFFPLLIGFYEFYKVVQFWMDQCIPSSSSSSKKKTQDRSQSLTDPLIPKKQNKNTDEEEAITSSQHDPLNESTMSVYSYHADVVIVAGKVEIRNLPSVIHSPTVTRNKDNRKLSSVSEISDTKSHAYQNTQTDDQSDDLDNHCSHSSDDDDSDDNDDDEVEKSLFVKYIRPCLQVVLNTNTLKVTLTIVADGSEEIAVFLPLLATSTPAQVAVITVTFYTLIFLQCFIAYQLIQCKYIGKCLSKYSKNVVPFVLIGLGLYILSDSILATKIQEA
jgi:cadmium resistance protein CadD (predicted permease)